MKINIYISLFLLIFFNISLPTCVYTPFDISMKTQNTIQKVNVERMHFLLHNDVQSMLAFFRAYYEYKSFLIIKPTVDIKIPKIIHQIWIGKEVPQEFESYCNSWKKHHPDWEYKLWTQHDIPNLLLHNKDLIVSSRNPGEISDLLRYEILYQFGGVYVDMDFECLAPLDELHYRYDFYIGLQPLDSELVQVGIGLIGTIPGHPILKNSYESIATKWHDPLFEHMATGRTGPIHFTNIFCDLAGKTGYCDVVLPAHYFYPLGCTEFELHTQEWLASGSFAVHHWAKSWLIPECRREQFRSIHN